MATSSSGVYPTPRLASIATQSTRAGETDWLKWTSVVSVGEFTPNVLRVVILENSIPGSMVSLDIVKNDVMLWPPLLGGIV